MDKNTENRHPKISVVMPVYNAARYLRESIDSILRQTCEDFEFIIINDGSVDESQKIIDEYAARDPRITSFHQKNHGVVYTANRAISMAQGEYIARMDADDISLPDRLRQESAILDLSPNVILVFSSFEVFNDRGEYCYRELVPYEDRDVKRALYFRNPIANGSTMLRRSSFEQVGRFDDVFAEDFQLWMKLLPHGKFQGTGTTLYRWRMNPDGLTLQNNNLSMKQGRAYIEDQWEGNHPQYLPRKVILSSSSHYLKDSPHSGRAYKEMYLTDLSQMAAKLFTHGYRLDGIKQLLIVASTGRTGAVVALRRIYFISRGSYGKLRKATHSNKNIYLD